MIDREEILKELKRLHADTIHSSPSMVTVFDGWHSSLQLSNFYVSGGTSAEMSEHDKSIYNEACSFLIGFAIAGKAY